MTKRILPWLIIGLVLRIFFMVSTVHVDIRGFNVAGDLIVTEGKLFTFYDHISRLPRDHFWVSLLGDDLFLYPPLPYWISGLNRFIWNPIFPAQLWDTLMLEFNDIIGDPQLPLMLFILKFPWLVFDLGCLWLITKLLKDKNKIRRIAQLLWIFNPVVLYAAYMVSQFDVMVVFFMLLSLYLAQKKRWHWAAAALGIGAGAKMFPLLVLPILAVVGGKRFIDQVKIFFIGIGSYLLIIAPYLSSPGFRQYALLASQTDKILFAKIPLTGAEFLPIFLVGLIALIWWAYFQPKKYSLSHWYLGVFILFFSLVHYHPQWLVYLTPWLIISLAKSWPRLVLPGLVLLGCYTIIVFMFEPSLNVELFRPIGLFTNFNFNQLIARLYEPHIFASIIRGIFAGTALTIFFFGFNKAIRSS